jgi:hypothetical protein
MRDQRADGVDSLLWLHIARARAQPIVRIHRPRKERESHELQSSVEAHEHHKAELAPSRERWNKRRHGTVSVHAEPDDDGRKRPEQNDGARPDPRIHAERRKHGDRRERAVAREQRRK